MMFDEDFESRILNFERDWQQHGRREIRDYLKCPGQATPEIGRRLLVELICVDLEFRWRNFGLGRLGSEWAVLEHYVSRFSELGALDHLPLELIGQEYRVRCQWGDRPTHDEFLSRFHSRRERICADLHQIDREIADESVDSSAVAFAQERTRATKSPDGPIITGNLVSHHDVLLQRMIGSGLTGKVYEAWQHSEGRSVAVKFLRKAFLHRPLIVQRFIDEANIVGKLCHPNIVEVYGLGRTSANAYFIVMELISGPNLDVLGRQRIISVREAVQMTIETCTALEHAHARGIVHCDLKPANLLLDRGGSIRVTDFGLSRTLFERMAWTGELEGTAPFMAPEQASQSWGSVDIRTDVYGLGAVLYALLTGRPPWVGRRLPDVLAQVVSGVPVVPPKSIRPDLPAAIDALCRKCLCKAPANRYSGLAEVRSELAKVMG
jgi:tRNA A-37 threonylcarbamoyl transferase component Bud32